MKNILLYKLRTGEELISDQATKSNGLVAKIGFDLRRTRLVTRVPTPQGIVMLLMTYWSNSPELMLAVYESDVIAHAEASKVLQDAFTQEVVGIQIAHT